MPFQDAPSPPMTPALYEQCERAMHVVLPDQHLLRGGGACLYILHVLGYRRTVAVFGLWPLSWMVDIGYAIVARNRLWFSRFLFTRD
jgi:predicted DCC family thiol-disulfide oxidoreductase YuxK